MLDLSLFRPCIAEVCEKMGTGTGRVLKNSTLFMGWPEPVPIFSQTLLCNWFRKRMSSELVGYPAISQAPLDGLPGSLVA